MIKENMKKPEQKYLKNLFELVGKADLHNKDTNVEIAQTVA